MSQRTALGVTMELLSDAIPGSGFSVPGGEDIAVCQDGQGYPYLQGSTMKGLLRESVENWLAWTGEETGAVEAVFGGLGWTGEEGERRAQFTPLTLCDPPAGAEDCYRLRTLTSLDGGVVKEGSLRTASCVRAGLKFSGEIYCHARDVELIQNALGCIRWMGTMRSRGFGRVRLRSQELHRQSVPPTFGDAHCICYRLRTETPVMITDLSRSRGNSYETRGYLPGSAIRGLVAGTLAARDPDWFKANRKALLSDSTRFLDAMPLEAGMTPLPAVKGFYEDKEEEHFGFALKDGTIPRGWKRARTGTFCALESDALQYWSAGTGGVTRIRRGGESGALPFQTRYLSPGQVFEGYIFLQEPKLAPRIAGVLHDTVWLGADRYEGFGKCSVQRFEAVDAPAWQERYGLGGPAGNTLYILALSPLTMQSAIGEPCGLDERELARKLGVGRADILLCSTSVSEYGGYDRTWASYAPALPMYDRGSLFKIQCSERPALERIRALEREGLGARRAEGYGQVLFLEPKVLENIRRKRDAQRADAPSDSPEARLRRARCAYLMEQARKVAQMRLSRSQLGDIQALCEKELARGGGTEELKRYLEHNVRERGARHGCRFEGIAGLIDAFFKQSLSKTLGVPAPEGVSEKLRLLCALIDHSRKMTSEEEEDR